MKIFLLCFIITIPVFAELLEPIHSSISTYLESKDYTHSKQKTDANIYGVGADLHFSNMAFKVAYEYGHSNTIQPPLSEDLEVQKLFTKLSYGFQNNFSFDLHYLNIISDNIAPTEKTQTYGVGVTYTFSKISMALHYYYSDYQIFSSQQNDLSITSNYTIEDINLKATLLGTFISLKDKDQSTFSSNAQENYFTSAIKLHAHYKTFHVGVGAYIGKRAFAVMNEGFKIQHHAMEFDRTYALGFGKTFKPFVLRAQYIYQRAEELPNKNENVSINILRLIANYKF